ncbi:MULTISPECIES: hypothetical protein [unclassified Nocardiopsis]|uniref:hypothetical protein n=1 Tax=Nocardiopsis TaxID=2013 RepID=UPI00387ABE91
MSQSSAALLGRALRMVGALFSLPRGRHTRPTLFGFRRRSRRVRRYAENPPPARRSTLHLPHSRPRPHPGPRLAPPTSVFDASDVPLVRPYYTDHERRRADHAADRAQAEALARLSRWSGAENRAPHSPTASAPVPAPGTVGLPKREPKRPPTSRVPAPRLRPDPHPPGDLLAPAPPAPPAPSLREVAADMGDLRAAVRTWVAQREAQEARRGLEMGV